MKYMEEARPKKSPSYRLRLKVERSDALYVQVLNKLTKEKLYRDPGYSAQKLAADLGTNVRYISACVANRTGDNYNALVNGLRLRDACQMLRGKRHARMSVEEVGLLAGFSSRQAFYTAFSRVYKTTPLAYRRQAESKEDALSPHVD